jgi:hypothetical protein
VAVRPDRKNIFAYQRFHIRRKLIIAVSEEISANPNGDREINLICEVGPFLLNDNVGSNPFGEVIHDETSKYFLGNVLHLF